MIINNCVCRTCGRAFYQKPASIRKGRGKFCSTSCYWSSDRRKEDPVDRFWRKVQIGAEDECWNWTASIGTHGYGQFTAPGHKVVTAHRHSYALTHGEIPRGMVVRHKCDNKRCVNPAHLQLGTSRDNNYDRFKRTGHRNQGEKNGMAKLTDRERALVGTSTGDVRSIAAKFGISPNYVYAIRSQYRQTA